MKPDYTFDCQLITGYYTVYGVRRKEKYLYIGMSGKLFGRFGGHQVIGGRLKLKPGDQLDVWLRDSRLDAILLEDELIKKYDPPYNGGDVITRELRKTHGQYSSDPEVDSLMRLRDIPKKDSCPHCGSVWNFVICNNCGMGPK